MITLLFSEFLTVHFMDGEYSRDILYLKVKIENDSIHLFVNHWPSRYTGTRNSDKRRIEAAHILFQKCDSILRNEINAKLILMGDFNDEPKDKSVSVITENNFGQNENRVMQNLMAEISNGNGTIKYNGMWSVFDQFIVSKSLLHSYNGLNITGNAIIASNHFLFHDDDANLGNMPFRTYNGFKYIGGYSDHLPVKLVVKYGR
jgi:endonuclease/exonuclease/phosphatase family metal-dependent hydrolase